LNGVTIIT